LTRQLGFIQLINHKGAKNEVQKIKSTPRISQANKEKEEAD